MRVTTTIDEALAERARQVAKSLNKSMSAFVSEAVRLRLEQLEQDNAYRELEGLVGEGFAKDSYKQSLRDMRDTCLL